MNYPFSEKVIIITFPTFFVALSFQYQKIIINFFLQRVERLQSLCKQTDYLTFFSFAMRLNKYNPAFRLKKVFKKRNLDNVSRLGVHMWSTFVMSRTYVRETLRPGYKSDFCRDFLLLKDVNE